MDAHKFGTFVAERRKEKKMTQADLAAKLQVTDKAVSRWERGLGFPDINTIEPLAEALGVSVLELMKSERSNEIPVNRDDADTAILDVLDAAIAQRREERKKLFTVWGLSVMAALLLFVVDNLQWDLSTLAFTVIGVLLPLAGAVSGTVLIGYGIWRKVHHKLCRRTLIAGMICLAAAALPFAAAFLLALLGGFPGAN